MGLDDMKKVLLLLTLIGCAALAQTGKTKPSALDKTTLENYVRHLFVWDSSIKVEVGDPKPAPFAGFVEINVRGSKEKAVQDTIFYVSKDGQHILRGDAYETAENPFKTDLDKLKGTTAFQPDYGTSGAPVVIVEFSDFECPYCQNEAKMLRTNLKFAYPKDVRLYHFDFPIDVIHPWARPAAIAGRCIFKQNAAAFWDFYDWIYSHQPEITADNVKAKVLEWAKDKSAIDSIQLARCMDSKETEGDVQAEVDEGKKLQVNQTPMIFINGRRLTGAVEWPNIKAVIDYEIEYQKTAKNAGEDCGCSVTLPTPGMQPDAPAPGGLKSN